VIINILSFDDSKYADIIHEAFTIIRKANTKIYSAEQKNIIRDGIGDKMAAALKDFPTDQEENRSYYSYVETMLRTALLYYDQTLYIKTKNLNNNLLIDWGAEELYIYLLSAIKKNSAKEFNDISNWLDKVFQPILLSTCTIIPHLPSKPFFADDSISIAYEYVKEKNMFNFCECQLDPINSAEYLSLKIIETTKCHESPAVKCQELIGN
jgi:hypothetical protein